MFNVLGEIDVKFVNQFKKYYEEKTTHEKNP